MKSCLKEFGICLSSLLIGGGLFAQGTSMVVTANTDLVSTPSTQIAFTGNFTNNSNGADFKNSTLILTGVDQTLTSGRTGSPTTLGGLVIGKDGETKAGSKKFSGNWEIEGPMAFNDGVIVPQTNGKITHTMLESGAGDILLKNPLSYINGTFYSKGKGTRVFPIGNNAGSFPALLSSVTQSDLEIGMQTVQTDAKLTHGSEILSVFKTRYWELIDPSQTLAGAKVSLSSLGTSQFLELGVGTVIVAAPGKGGAAADFGGAADGDFIVGTAPIQTTDRIFTLAKISSELVKLKIHNVITPFLDNANDYLQIENINIFPENKVTLLDRWGAEVKQWANFANVTGSPDPSYDLSKIATGNYICILEYMDGSNKKSLSQMITIVNQ